MKKKIITPFFLFFSFYSVFSVSFSMGKDTQVKILPPKNITNCILYDLLFFENSYFIAFLTKDKEIKFGFLDPSDDSFTIDAVSSIYKYEKADAVEYIDSFFYNNKFYITHLERFSFEIFLTSFTNKNDISTKKIGETALPPKIFLNNNILNCFFKDKNKNIFSLKSINLSDDKIEEIDGESDISFFDVSSSKNGYYSIIWQNEKDLKNFYISIINNKFTPLSNVNLIKFNQKIHPPKALLTDKYFNLIFSIDYTNYYFRYPLGEDIRNYTQVKFPEEFHSYNMDFFTYLESIYIVILKKTVENRLKEKSDIIEILFYDNNFDYCISRKITAIEGEIRNFSFATLNENLYLFWLEKIKDKSVIRSSKVLFSKE